MICCKCWASSCKTTSPKKQLLDAKKSVRIQQYICYGVRFLKGLLWVFITRLDRPVRALSSPKGSHLSPCLSGAVRQPRDADDWFHQLLGRPNMCIIDWRWDVWGVIVSMRWQGATWATLDREREEMRNSMKKLAVVWERQWRWSKFNKTIKHQKLRLWAEVIYWIRTRNTFRSKASPMVFGDGFWKAWSWK